jgi:hypothetical protein
MKVSVLLFLALVAGSCCATQQVKYSNCTDEAFCLSGCQSAEVPADQCIGFEPSSSEIIVCDPVLSVVGDLSYFSDSGCSNLWFTNAFLCGYCSANGNGSYSQVHCDRTDGTEFIAIYKCQGNKSTNATGTNCKANCSNPWNVTKGQCIPTEVSEDHIRQFQSQQQRLRAPKTRLPVPKAGQLMYAMYTGAATATTVRVTQWLTNSKCQGTPTRSIAFADRSCIHGTSLTCIY